MILFCFRFWFDTLLRNNVYQAFYFGYCELTLINLAFDPIQLEFPHSLLDIGYVLL